MRRRGKGKQRFLPSQLQTELSLCGTQILLVSKFLSQAGEQVHEDRREIRLVLRSETRASAMMAMIVAREAKKRDSLDYPVTADNRVRNVRLQSFSIR